MSEAKEKKLSIVIMAHPARRAMAEALALSLGGVPIVWDMINDVWDTCRRSWQAIDKTAEYGLVLQDDVIVCNGFIRRAEAIVGGGFIYNFFIHYIFADRVKKALSEGKSAFFRTNICSELAICMPTKYIDSMVKYVEEHGGTSDTLISQWANSRHIRVCYPIPSLVDNRAGES